MKNKRTVIKVIAFVIISYVFSFLMINARPWHDDNGLNDFTAMPYSERFEYALYLIPFGMVGTLIVLAFYWLFKSSVV